MPAPAKGTLRNTMYMTGAGFALPHQPPPPPAHANPIIYRNEHVAYTAAHARVQTTVTAYPGVGHLATLASAQNALGDTLYLKFFANHISSIRLPDPPPAGVNFFYTDNLSGCRIFVDRVTGSNDLIVYHANTTQHTAGHLTYADYQTGGASGVLDTMHANAALDYGIALTPVVASTLGMPRYFREPANEERRKKAQGRRATAHDAPGRVVPGQPAPPDRTRPLFYGGCFVCGYYAGGWRLYFQSWGAVSYARPLGQMLLRFDWKGIHKLRTQGKDVQVGYADMNVMERARFF